MRSERVTLVRGLRIRKLTLLSSILDAAKAEEAVALLWNIGYSWVYYFIIILRIVSKFSETEAIPGYIM